jgi:hypothetical protein
MSVRNGLRLNGSQETEVLRRQMNDSKEFHRQQMTLYSN